MFRRCWDFAGKSEDKSSAYTFISPLNGHFASFTLNFTLVRRKYRQKLEIHLFFTTLTGNGEEYAASKVRSLSNSTQLSINRSTGREFLYLRS